MTSSTLRIFLLLFTLVAMIAFGCKKKDKDDDGTTPTPKPDPPTNLVITGPDSLTIILAELDSFTISGGVPSYSIPVEPDTAVAIVNIYGNLLVIEGNGIGSTDMKVGDTGGDSVWLNLKVTGPLGNYDWLNGTFTAFIDGTPFVGTNNDGAYNSEIISITGVGPDGVINVATINVTGTGPYTIALNTASYVDDSTPAQTYTNSSTAGSMFITILKAGNLKGTFLFEGVNNQDASDVIMISGGVFDLVP